jgi:Ca2+-binding RTX toxin-like protein
VGSPTPVDLLGGSGNFSIVAGAGNDSLGGDDGNDQLLAGPGNDELFDFDGADTLDGGEGDDTISPAYYEGPDTYSGGPGLDTLSRSQDIQPLRLTLDGVADDGFITPIGSSAFDNVMPDIENVGGSEGADVISGGAAANSLEGFAGNDIISGGAGSDELDGGRGDDTLDGGADPDTLDGAEGVDLIKSRDGGADQLDCGSSTDTVIGDSFDLAPASCEIVSAGVVIGKAKAKKKKVKLELTCPAAEGAACPVEAKLSFKGEKIASGSGTIAAGQTQNLKLKLKKAGRELLSDHDKPKVDAKVTYTDPAGAVVVTSAKVVLG